MSASLESMVKEAERRGMVTPEMRTLLDEARRRGMFDPPKTPFGDTVVTTALPRPEQKLTSLPEEEGPALVLDYPKSHPDFVMKAADAGVIYDVPASGGHFLSSLAYDRKNEVEAYRQSLNREGQPDIDVRVGADSEQIEYYIPEQKRYSIAKPPHSPLAELQGLGGIGITLLPEAAAGVGAAMLSKSPFVTTLGAGAGAVLGEMMRLELGARMGINQDMTGEQQITQATKVGAIAAGTGVAADKIFKFARFTHNLISGKYAQEDLIGGISMDEAIELQNAINSQLRSNEFRFDLAQSTGHKGMLEIKDYYAKSREFGEMFGDFSDQQDAALTEYWAAINRPYRTRQSPEEVLEGAQGVAEAQRQRPLVEADIHAETMRARLNENLSALSERPPERLGSLLRDVGDTEQKAFRDWADEAATNLNSVVGDAAFIPNTNTHAAVAAISDETRTVLFDQLRRSERTLVGEEPTGVIEAAAEAAMAGKDEEAEALLSGVAKVWNPAAEFTFEEAWLTSSALKRLERKAGKGLSTDAPDVGTVKRLIAALERDIDEGFNGSEAAELYSQFKDKYSVQKRRLDEGTVAELMQRKGGKRGRYVLSNEKAFRDLMVPGDPRPAQEIYRLVENDVEAVDAIREGFASLYRRSVVKDGRIGQDAHDKFMGDHGGQLGVFFDRGEMRMIQKRRGLESALKAREAQRKHVLEEVNDTFETEITSLKNIDQLTRIALDTNQPSKAAELVGLLEGTPAVLRGVRAKVREKMHEKVMGPARAGERVFSAPKFNDYLNGTAGETGRRGNLAAIFGEDYAKNLDTLNQTLKFVSREPKHPNRSNTAFWIDTTKNLTRAYVGLFTKAGRFVTAIDRLRGRVANRTMARTILNPEDLDKLMSLKGVDMRSAKARSILASLGATGLYAGPTEGE